MASDDKFQVIMAQMRQSQLRAQLSAFRISSGAYKDKVGKMYHGGLPENGGVACTEEQLLQHELGIMSNHIRNAEMFLEAAMNEPSYRGE